MLLLLAPIRSPGYYYQQQHGYMAWPPICVDMIVKFHEFSFFFLNLGCVRPLRPFVPIRSLAYYQQQQWLYGLAIACGIVQK